MTYLKVLSPAEVGRLLDAAPGPGLKYKAALSIAYGAGLRAGEVMMLRVSAPATIYVWRGADKSIGPWSGAGLCKFNHKSGVESTAPQAAVRGG